MKKEIDYLKLNSDFRDHATIDIPSKCPICNTAYGYSPIYACCHEVGNIRRLITIFFCPTCEKFFSANYNLFQSYKWKEGFLDAIYPTPCHTTSFSPSINNLSPRFIDIYNQAEMAEHLGLFEICGLGFRKALEFLIKDFAIHIAPTEESRIKAMPLMQCVNRFITVDNVRTLAERSAWIGNDEAHYVRKQENRDVSDMKNFIHATVYFISMTLITEDAASMTPK